MNRIRIGTSEKELTEASESWIIQQVRQREHDGQSVCAQVILRTDGVNLILSTPQCTGSGGGGRQPNQKEQEILELWQSRNLNQTNWAVGNLIAFLKQLRRLVG